MESVRRYQPREIERAQFERTLLSERVKAGMARAKAQGKRISRAPIPRGVPVASVQKTTHRW